MKNGTIQQIFQVTVVIMLLIVTGMFMKFRDVGNKAYGKIKFELFFFDSGSHKIFKKCYDFSFVSAINNVRGLTRGRMLSNEFCTAWSQSDQSDLYTRK